ncbi:MAG: hypothetical protein H7Y88_04475 [Phycisphaerales bacterium]|nr:hypothetical protein [Phycisphaerales bacterium]
MASRSHLNQPARALGIAAAAALVFGLVGCAGDGASSGDNGSGASGGFFGFFAPPQPGPNDIRTPMSEYERSRLLARVRSDPAQLAKLNKRERYNISRIVAAANANDSEDE